MPLKRNTVPNSPEKMPHSKVVDSWALLAWLRDEHPAADSVRRTLQEAEDGNVQLCMSWINAGEVYYMLARKHDAKNAEEFLIRLPSLPIRLVLRRRKTSSRRPNSNPPTGFPTLTLSQRFSG